MSLAKEDQPGHQWKRVLIAALVIVGIFLVVFVPTYIILQKDAQPYPLTREPCAGFPLPPREQQAPLYQATEKKPNFIFILVDDMGYDDVGLHHPYGGQHSYLTTPNINKLLQQGMEFNNFYTTPMCSTSRAELLTGRWYPRTGAMYINTGWDFINANETMIPRVLNQAGYKTAVFGKWHNGRTAGYQPYDVGFDDSFLPTPYVFHDNLLYINGNPVQTEGWLEENLMGHAIHYMKTRQEKDQPFFLYYPAYSVHAGWTSSQYAGGRYQRPAPPHLIEKYSQLPLNEATAHLYAMMEYMDLQIGRLMSFLDKSGLSENTYVMLTGDNGPALFSTEAQPLPKVVRMPSGMQGSKHTVREGGIRHFLAVRGPGVSQGGVSRALTGLVDVLPTIADLAGLQEVPVRDTWDGISFANILRGQEPTQQQSDRMIFSMETTCIEEDFVPLLKPNRRVDKSQVLLNFNKGGVNGQGFKRCVGVRYKNYKWLADATTTRGQGPAYRSGRDRLRSALYKFKNEVHVELPCQEVSASEPRTARFLESQAAQWWRKMLASQHSFEKPTFFIGLAGRNGTNIVADGAIQRTRSDVFVLPMGLSGFKTQGDSAYYRIKVVTSGSYQISLFYQSNQTATFKLWFGPFEEIEANRAVNLEATLPVSDDKRSGLDVGSVYLPETPPGETWELKLELIGNSRPGQAAIVALDTIYFLRQGDIATVPRYDPDDQEGVKTWKMTHGYQYVRGG